MNTIDFIVCLVLVLAVWKGWRRGFIVQLCSLTALVVGLWLAARHGTAVGEWLRLDESVRTAGGFVAVLLVAMLSIAVAGRVLRRLFRFAGFGLLDVALGVVVCTLKYMLLVSVLLTAFDRINSGYSLVGERTIASSKSYRPLLRISEALFPVLERVSEHVPQMQDDKLQNA
ncbi:MAG: CvpA family protein [Bacteroides cellulosilyticus]|nr:CvpA family protein [Bacteroides cellulosilyticus]